MNAYAASHICQPPTSLTSLLCTYAGCSRPTTKSWKACGSPALCVSKSDSAVSFLCTMLSLPLRQVLHVGMPQRASKPKATSGQATLILADRYGPELPVRLLTSPVKICDLALGVSDYDYGLLHGYLEHSHPP